MAVGGDAAMLPPGDSGDKKKRRPCSGRRMGHLPYLERDLRLELDDSRRSVRAQTGTVDAGRAADCRNDLAKLASVVHIHDREIEIRVIEQVEESSADGELRSLPALYAERFFDGKIGVEVERTTILVTPLVSVGGGWICKYRRR